MNLEDSGNATKVQSRIYFKDIDLSNIIKKTNGDKHVEGNEPTLCNLFIQKPSSIISKSKCNTDNRTSHDNKTKKK